jgi:hypothetical protein
MASFPAAGAVQHRGRTGTRRRTEHRAMAAANRPVERITRRGLRLLLGLQLLLPALGQAATVPERDIDTARPVIPLANGLNTLSLTSAALPAQAFLAHRDNANAHGFEVLTLYIQAPSSPGTRPRWQLVPAFDTRDAARGGVPGGEHLTLKAHGGADCRLGDFRLLAATARADALLILADREPGDSFASAAPVRFRFFKLKTNTDGVPGRPVYYFEFDHERRAAKPYCDVGDALQAELGVGPYEPAQP